MGEYAAQSVLHAAVAVVVVETLVRVWRVEDPPARLAFRLLPLAYPLVILPVFLLVAPGRGTEAFRDGWALFAASRWAELPVPGLPVGPIVFALTVLLGTGLFLRDLLRLLLREGAARDLRGAAGAAATDELAGEVGPLAARLGVPAPPVRLIDTDVPVLLVAGIRRPMLVVSRGTLARLDARERRAALAHELAHLARHDPLLGWGLMACRLAAFFNPAVQLAARGAVRDMEARADDLAIASTGDHAALVSGLAKLAGATPAGGLLARIRTEGVHARLRRLGRPAGGQPRSLAGLRLGLAGAALTLLLFFVV